MARYKFANGFIYPTLDAVLDYGCGTGYGTQMLNGNRVVGVDCSTAALEIAQSRYSPIFQQWNVLTQGPVPGDFNVIVCMEVIEHMSKGQGDKMVEVFHDMLLDGMLIISTPKHKPLEERSPYRQRHHVYEYTYQAFEELLHKWFSRVAIFTQTDEVITMGNKDVCWTYIGVCYA